MFPQRSEKNPHENVHPPLPLIVHLTTKLILFMQYSNGIRPYRTSQGQKPIDVQR